MKEVGTLKGLGVKPGDILQWKGGDPFPCKVVRIDKGIVHMETPGGNVSYLLQYCHNPWVVISRASDNPKLWRDMTPEEKGALLLAHHEGKVIEGKSANVKDWVVCNYPGWHKHIAYRIKPEPKIETVMLHWAYNRGDAKSCLYEHTHCITFNIIDGEPDYTSIKMEPRYSGGKYAQH